MLLDAVDGAYGCLYVANRGSGFLPENVQALCDIAMSTKPPGQAIGSKCLGFRSVRHVTDAPEIYSQAEPITAKPAFDGFCFSFAMEADLNEMLPDARHRELARRDLPRFHIPRWLPEQPESVRAFAARGFSTVVRLPIRDGDALKIVKDELAALRAQSAPMLLFLNRLARLTASIVHSGDPEGNVATTLERAEIAFAAAGPRLSIARLRHAGTFLIARKSVSESAMLAAIQSGVASTQLHDSWNAWRGEGEVALAVRLDGGPVAPRLYTFLPMGKEAVAPFNGFLHGTFFPSSSRKTLDSGVALNRLILAEAAVLAGSVVAQLSRYWPSHSSDGCPELLDEVAAAKAAVDLLVWRKTDSIDGDGGLDLPAVVAASVVAEFGVASLDDAPIVPSLGVRTGGSRARQKHGPVVWCKARSVRRWKDDVPTFNVQVIANHGAKGDIAPFWPGLGRDRIQALSTYLSEYMKDWQDQLSGGERAQIAASVAATIPHGKKPALARWTAFYRDLLPFMERNLGPLAGLEILLCSDGTLRPAMKARSSQSESGAPRRRRRKGAVIAASVFAPPRGSSVVETAAGAELMPPTVLKPHFAFLADTLPWYDELQSARTFFEGKLFDAFDSDTVLTRLSQVLVSDAAKETRTVGLRWAFLIWRRAQASNRSIQLRSQHRFFVPTIDGRFIEAQESVFSASWPEETQGRRLQQFLDLAPVDSADLNGVRARRLAPTRHRPFGTGRLREWMVFLTELGVQRGLFPVEKRVAGQVVAHRLSSFEFTDALGMPKAAVKLWKADVAATVAGGVSLPSSTGYIINGSLWWIPGQGDHDRFSIECRELYATLIVDWITRGGAFHWEVEIHHHHSRWADSRQWPTPLASFIRAARWMPADEPSPSGVVRDHFAPKDTALLWHRQRGCGVRSRA